MSHVEIKDIGGRLYKYKRTNYRVGKTVRHHDVYLGPVNPIRERKKSTGRKPVLFVRSLTDEEKQELEKAKKSQDSFKRDRALIILYSSEALSPVQIAKKVHREIRAIRRAIKDFNEKGLTSLKRGKTTGRKKKFKEKQRAEILQVINTDPRKLGQNFTTWSLPKLKEYLIENKIVERISIETIRTIMRKENIKYKRSRKWQYSNDPKFGKKNSQ